jgi:hypothetical protein
MSVHDKPIYDLVSLSWLIAEDAMGHNYSYRRKDFGQVEGFEDWNYIIRPGITLNTDHILFLYDKGSNTKVGVDQYGDIYIYNNNPSTKLLACIIADAKRDLMSREEVAYTESTDHIGIPDLSVRMAL